MNPQIIGTSPFAPADFEASSTMCTRCFEIQSSPGCTCTRRLKILTHTVKKIFRITDEFAHNYVIFVTILCPTLTKMDTLIIQNKLRILRNGFQNSRNPFPILVDFQKSGKDYKYSVINYIRRFHNFFLILLFISFHFILDMEVSIETSMY